MDGAVILLVQIPVTVITVAIGFWQVHEKLRDRIDKGRDAANAAKEESIRVGTKMDGFVETCQAHRGAFDKRISRVEGIVNSKKCGPAGGNEGGR